MSPRYDLTMNSKYNRFIHSEIHMALSITLSNAGHVNRHSLHDCHFQHMSAKVLFHTTPNTNLSMT